MTEDELAEALEALKEGVNLPFSVLKKVMIHMGRWPGSSVAVKDNSSGVGTVTGSKDAPVHVKWRSTDKYDENHPLAQFEEDRLRRMEQRRQEFLRKGHEEMGIVVGTKKAAEVEQLKDQQQDLYAQLDKLEAEEAKVKRRDHIMHQAFLERHQEEFGSQLPQLSDERWVVEEEKILEEKQRNMERNGRRTKPNGPISRLREKLRESQAARDDIKAEMDRLIQEERLVEEEIEDRKNHREFNAEREEAFNQFKKRMQSVMETNKNQKLIHGNFKDHHEYPTVDFDTWMREHKDAGMEGGL